MKITARWLALLSLPILLGGCFDIFSEYGDIDDFIEETRSQPTGTIAPLPEFQPYQAFTYRSSTLRSPFKQPVKLDVSQQHVNNGVQPDKDRRKEYLEQFDIGEFDMVGSISNSEGLWGLVRGQDGIHRVKVGDYIGKNHGRVVFIDDEQIKFIEIVPVGPGYWAERARVLTIDN